VVSFILTYDSRGIIFDVIECIIQRDLSYATLDIRSAYSVLVDLLAKPTTEKVVLFLHSQGGIEGGMVLDWLYDTVPAQQLSKLEIYTFGNAANHWNAPVISSTGTNAANGADTKQQRIVKHIEHYANEGDYVSKFGVLHFRPEDERNTTGAPSHPSDPPADFQTSSAPQPQLSTKNPSRVQSAPVTDHIPKLKTQLSRRASTWTPSTPTTPIENHDLKAAKDNNRFFGRLFKRASSGHLLNMHYLDTMFEMESLDLTDGDRSKGKVKEGNEFMDTEIDEKVLRDFDTVQAIDEDEREEPRARLVRVGRRVKDCSRLWEYRNGGSPRD
jgi:hypothetical protein